MDETSLDFRQASHLKRYMAQHTKYCVDIYNKGYSFLTGNANLPAIRTNFNFLTNKEVAGPPTYNNYNHILSYMLLDYD